MLSKSKRRLLAAAFAIFAVSLLDCRAQFKEEAFSQKFNDDQANQKDTTDKNSIFSLKKYWGALGHKNTMDVTTAFCGSTVLVGGMQIYNKDYWKLPVVYGGIAAGVVSGIWFNTQGKHDTAAWCFAGAGLVYWGTLMDGVINFIPDDWPQPGKAPLYSLLLPGLGQIYNHEIWKLPIYYGIMIGGLDYYFMFKKNFERFRTIYNNQDTTYFPLETSKYYKNLYRRYRAYALLVVFAGYFLPALDANVCAYMHNFEVTEDLTLDISPTIIAPNTDYAMAPVSNMSPGYSPAIGLSIGLKF